MYFRRDPEGLLGLLGLRGPSRLTSVEAWRTRPDAGGVPDAWGRAVADVAAAVGEPPACLIDDGMGLPVAYAVWERGGGVRLYLRAVGAWQRAGVRGWKVPQPNVQAIALGVTREPRLPLETSTLRAVPTCRLE
jgi:hypothetical protein